MAIDSNPAAAHVTTPSGRVIGIAAGSRLVFGRGAGADLVIPAGRGLSRRAGVISAVAAGAWVANISSTHALYAEGDGYRIRLPRMDAAGEPSAGWFVRQGTALVGSRAMLDEGQPLRLVVTAARAALEATDAHHEIERFDTDPAFRDRLSARVGEHLKVLRRKIIERGLVRPGIRLSDEVAVGVLIENGTIAAADLARLSDPAWCSRQEDLWWTQAT